MKHVEDCMCGRNEFVRFLDTRCKELNNETTDAADKRIAELRHSDDGFLMFRSRYAMKLEDEIRRLYAKLNQAEQQGAEMERAAKCLMDRCDRMVKAVEAVVADWSEPKSDLEEAHGRGAQECLDAMREASK